MNKGEKMENKLNFEETMKELEEKLKLLGKIKYDEDFNNLKVKEIIKQVVPTYREPQEVNEEATKKLEMVS